MKKARIILLCILIPLFILSIIYYYSYNSPKSVLNRQFKAVVKSQGDLKEYLKKIASLDSERVNLENQQRKKVFDFIKNKKEELLYNKNLIKDFIVKNVDTTEVTKQNKILIGEMQLFRDQVRRCRELIEQINLDEAQKNIKNISDYQKLEDKFNLSISLLAYFAGNYQAALELNQAVIDNLEDSVLIENRESVLKPIDRYFKNAEKFSNLFNLNYQNTQLTFKNLGKKTAVIFPLVPKTEDAKKVIKKLTLEKYKIIGQIQGDVNDDSIDELILLLSSEKNPVHILTYLTIFKWENSEYKKAAEINLDEIVSPAYKGPVLTNSQFFLHYSSLIPEIVVLTGTDTEPVISFRYDGADYKNLLP